MLKKVKKQLKNLMNGWKKINSFINKKPDVTYIKNLSH